MCDCISTVNAMLAEHNTALTVPIQFGGGPARLVVDTHQIESGRGKKKAAIMCATFCPFCGERYVPEQATPASIEEASA